MILKRIKGIYTHLPLLWKFAIAIIILLIGLSTIGSAYTISDTSVYPPKIFKCQYAFTHINFSDDAGIVAINVWHNSSVPVMVNGTTQTSNHYGGTFINLGGGSWISFISFGNDPALLYGNRTVTFYIQDGGGWHVEPTATTLFIYSDDCTGTNIEGYQNTSYRNSGFGNYTRPLFSGQRNLLEFSIQPYLDYFGSIIYVLIMFLICVIIYMKNQSVIQPIIIVFITAVSLVGSGLLPQEYRIYALFLTGLAMAAIFWRLGKSA